MTECQLLMDPQCSGAWNMAVDEVLLAWSARHGGTCWRFYGWREPTLSLGYFQAYEERRQHASSRDCALVRRLTGGGAILHDIELTYSIVVPAAHPLAAERDSLYEIVHTSLIELLADMGITARLCGPDDRRRADPASGNEEPFLCFQRRAPGDVLVGNTKICGSAQRRRRGAVLQHGSVLLGRSSAAPQLGALEDVSGKKITPDDLADAWLGRLATRLDFQWREKSLTEQQKNQADAWLESRYATPGWNEHRQR